MVLATLAWLAAFGLLQRSALFVLWVVAVVAPAWIAFLKVYEERELEIPLRRGVLGVPCSDAVPLAGDRPAATGAGSVTVAPRHRRGGGEGGKR